MYRGFELDVCRITGFGMNNTSQTGGSGPNLLSLQPFVKLQISPPFFNNLKRNIVILTSVMSISYFLALKERLSAWQPLTPFAGCPEGCQFNSLQRLPIWQGFYSDSFHICVLTHWGRMTHICVSKLISIGSDNGLSPGRRQAIIWTNAGILSNGRLGTNFNEFSIEIHTFSFMKMHLKISSGKWRPFCLGLNVLRTQW